MKPSKEDIFNRIVEVLEEQFEIEADKISLESTLVEDLDIDSIDAVDLMIELKSLTGRKMALEDFQQVRKINDVVNAVYRVAQENNESLRD